MKKLSIIVNPSKLEQTTDIFDSCAIYGLMVTEIMGYGSQKGYTTMYRGVKGTNNILYKCRVETIADDDTITLLEQLLTEKLATGKIGDGKIFVENVRDVVRIRTGERGSDAL